MMCETTIKNLKKLNSSTFVYLMSTGTVTVAENGIEIRELCGLNWVEVFVRHLVLLGFDPDGIVVNTSSVQFRVRKEDEEYYVDRI